MSKLFKPIKIGTIELKNRIVMPPMGTNFASDDGFVTKHLVNYHVERAKGGVHASLRTRTFCARAYLLRSLFTCVFDIPIRGHN